VHRAQGCQKNFQGNQFKIRTRIDKVLPREA
jgi:hypothetical protein